MVRKERTPQDKTQAGDPLPVPDNDEDRGPAGSAMTLEELIGRGNLGPISAPINLRTGPIGPVKKCGWCGEGLNVTADHCPKCVPNASRPVAINGVPEWLNGSPLRR